MAQQQATTTKAKRSKRKPVAEQDSQVDQPPIGNLNRFHIHIWCRGND